MGRKPSKPNAIPRLRARKQKSGRVCYYYDHGVDRTGKRREEPLGSEYGLAIKRWAELEHDRSPPAAAVLTFRHVADRYRAEVIPTKAPRTQKDNIHELGWLLRFFDDPPGPFEEIKPVFVRKYREWRTAKVRANREIALLSHLWNWAREKGYTALPNPCEGVKRNREDGRDVYVEDDVYRAVYVRADQPLRDALDLAYLTGQRPADTYAMDERQITPTGLRVRQGKTGAKVEIAVSGELAALLDRIRRRKAGLTLHSTRLVVDERGLALGRDALRYRFDKARRLAGVAKGDFQFRDLRAKAGTDKADDSGDIRQAQAQLGHASVTMTEHYVRKRKGAKVTPTR
jgi:integrase